MTSSSTACACTIRRCTRTSSSRTAASGLRPARWNATPPSCASSATRACPPTSAAARTRSTRRRSPKSTPSCSPLVAASCRTTTPNTSRCRRSATCIPTRTSRSIRSWPRSSTSSYGDWCWIETRRGRIKMRANVEPEVASATWCSRRAAGGSPSATARPTWTTRSAAWSPTSTCSPRWTTGTATPWAASWANRGLMCKVYKCGDFDKEFKPERQAVLHSGFLQGTGHPQ